MPSRGGRWRAHPTKDPAQRDPIRQQLLGTERLATVVRAEIERRHLSLALRRQDDDRDA
jgi:hypothetical protein